MIAFFTEEELFFKLGYGKIENGHIVGCRCHGKRALHFVLDKQYKKKPPVFRQLPFKEGINYSLS